MKCKKINENIIKFLKDLTDDNCVDVIQSRHIKVIGIFGGEKRTCVISPSPKSRNYEKNVTSYVRRFLKSLNIECDTSPYFK